MKGEMQDARLLKEAAREVREMRRQIEILSAQMYVVHTFNAAVNGGRGGTIMGAGEDIAWRLEGRANEIEKSQQVVEEKK